MKKETIIHNVKDFAVITFGAALAAAAVASITTVIILAVHHKKKKKLANEEIDLFGEESDAVAEDADIA